MIFDSDSSSTESGSNPTSCFCDSSRKGVDGASLRRREKEIIQLASVRNKAICFRETSNYNRRQRKLANFLSLDRDSDGTERRSGDWIMSVNRAEDRPGSVKTYPWTTTSTKQKFELVPWRKHKRQLDIINFTAWEPDELGATDANGLKARRYKQHPPPAAHNQEIRRLIRLRFLFSLELQRQKQLKMISGRGNGSPEESVITPRKFENVPKRKEGKSGSGSDREVDKDSACDINDDSSFYDDPQELATNFVGYFGSTSGQQRPSEGGGSESSGSGKQNHSLETDRCSGEESVEHCMTTEEALSGFNYSDWLACCDSFKCDECKRY